MQTWKKIWIYLFLLFFVADFYAESDIQLSWPMISLFENKYVEWENYSYKRGKSFDFSGNLFEITNHNFIWSEKIGFYESFALMADKYSWGEDNLCFLFSGGVSYKVLENRKLDLLADGGLHIDIHSFEFIELGVESDFQFKFTPKRRCSPIFGINVNFNFYTNGKSNPFITEYNCDYRNSYWRYKPDSDIKKYFKFCILPYIALGFNI